MKRRALLVLGVLLLVAGILALVYGGFSYPKESHSAKLGPIDVSVQERDKVKIPPWAGVAAIVVGAGLLFVAGRK